ncbi:MAG: tetratricopeptide repeat protein [Planctomycetales bacterium]|nr:tetratricopeptide repeat protein [Planctomycetales bacterium]
MVGVLQKRRALRAASLAIQGLLLCLLLSGLGCRTLRTRRQTQALSDARQNSLRGAEKLQQNKLKDAEFLFSEALRRSTADERAHWGMAEVLWQQGERGRAIEHMVRAAAISGENPDLLVRLGEMNLQEGYLDQALVQADAALQSQRHHAGAWALRGQVLHKRQQFEPAMDCYHRALINQPNSPHVQEALAELYHALGRPQRALATLDYMTDGQPEEKISAKTWMLKGQALADLGESAAAKNCLRNAALCAADDDMDLLLALVESQIATGDLAEARVCLGRAFRHDPQNPTALRMQNTLQHSFHQSTTPGNLVGFGQSPSAGFP